MIFDPVQVFDMTVMLLQAVKFKGRSNAIRLDLTRPGLEVKKVKVGPFNSGLFDSGVAVSSGPG